jgi:flagellar hook-associated protein 2
MATLSSLGIGSGLDTAAMLAQMKIAEQTRLNPYTNLKSGYENKISAWGKISSALSSLQTTIKKLSGEAFNTLTVSENKAFKATATSDADADSHSITVSQLATGHKLKTEGQTSNEAQLGEQNGGSRTLTITQKNGKEVKVTLKDDETSLEQIAKKINKEDGDVRASVQRTGSEYVLVLSSRTTGTDGEMSVSVEGDDKLANILDTTSGGKMISIAQAQDAELTVDGIKYTRSSNSISDIITGVTLNLKSVSENGASEQLTLNVDNTAIKSTIKDFVKQYNALLTQTSAASKYVPKDTSGLADDQVATTSSENGALMGDGTLRSLVGELRSAVNNVYGEKGADYDSLASLGIKIDAATGQMTLDEKKLDKAVEDNPEEIARIFKGRGDSEGLAGVLSETVTKYVGDTENKKDGLIKGMTDSLDEQVKLVKEQIDKTQKLIDAQVERYRVQFQNLDSTMSQLNNLSNQLTAVLSTIG